MTGLLIFIGLILVILNVLSIKKQNKSFDGALGNAIGNVDDYDIRLAELRREFAESILEVQSEIMELREIMAIDSRLNKNYDSQMEESKINFEKIEKNIPLDSYSKGDKHINIEEINYDEHNDNISIDEPSINNSNSTKVEEIKKLFSEGLSAEEISDTLHLGKGEVLLIKDLYIR